MLPVSGGTDGSGPAGNGSYRTLFRYHGRQHVFTLGRVTEAEAVVTAGRVEHLLMRLKQGLIRLPAGSDIVAFVRPEATDDGPPEPPPADRHEPTLADLRDRYLETHGNGSVEFHTHRGIRRHFRHLVAHLGEGFPVRRLSLADLQG